MVPLWYISDYILDTSHFLTPVSDLGSAAETSMETNEPDVQLVTERSNVDDDSTLKERMSKVSICR